MNARSVRVPSTLLQATSHLLLTTPTITFTLSRTLA